ncbi:MAG: hypothetical protein WCG92_04470 [Hyphomicrobiales bacterium]|nr:hypothetical protein [Alphaproteobacteria bacterium]
MIGADRVAVVGLLWFAVWIAAGHFVGLWFDVPGTGRAGGFLLALATVWTWPWVLPNAIDEWMYDPRAR